METQVELKSKNDIWTEPDKQGKQKLVKRNVIARIYVDIKDIKGILEVYSYKGKVLKNECKIQHEQMGPLIVNHSYEYMKKLKEGMNSNNSIGFKK